jgi:fructosamine-3-kinase
MEQSAFNREIDLFCSARQSSFLFKADLKIENAEIHSLQKHKEAETLANVQNITRLSRQFFGKNPHSVIPLSRYGTFHLLYRVLFSETESYVIRTSMSAYPFRASDFYLDRWALNILKQQKLPALRIYDVDLSRAKYPFDYEIMAEARGSLFNTLAIDYHDHSNIVTKLGFIISLLHKIKTAGFGLIDIRRVLSHQAGEGLSNTWVDFVCRNLEEHLRTCCAIQALSLHDGQKIESMFENARPILKSIQPSLLHGDLSNGNIFSDGREITAIIDWEDCLSGDPIFDIAFWGTFIGNDERRKSFLNGYQSLQPLPVDFELRYWLYYLRIVLAKTVLRYRFNYYLQDRIPASFRLKKSLSKLESILS